MKLDPWQVQALECQTDLLLCTGRQVGKTTLLSVKAGKFLIEKPKSTIICCSLTEDQAKLIILMTLIYLEQNFKPYLKVKKKDKPTLNKIMLSNGSQILARPVGNTGDALRGFTGDVFIMDELSRWPELALTAGLPTLLTTGGEIWGASTPFGKQGFFYEAFQNKDKFWKVIHVTSEKVIADRPISESWTIKQHDGALRFLEQQKLGTGPMNSGMLFPTTTEHTEHILHPYFMFWCFFVGIPIDRIRGIHKEWAKKLPKGETA